MSADGTTAGVPLEQVFTFLLLMLGPFKIIGPFSKITRAADPGLTRRLAVRAIVISSIALLLASFLGETLLDKYHIPLQVLILSGGLILFLVALQSTLQQFVTPEQVDAAPTPPTMQMAMSPLAFPIIVTPYGIAALIVFFSVTPDLQGKLMIGAVLLGIMFLNLVAMLLARKIPRSLGVFLQIFGAVLGIIQVALGLSIIVSSLKRLLGGSA